MIFRRNSDRSYDSNLGPSGKCRPGRSSPCLPNHHVKAKPTPALLMLLIERNVRKCLWGVNVVIQVLLMGG